GVERIPKITDGTSNTLLVGEYTNKDERRPNGEQASGRATFWSYTYASYNQASVTTESRVLNNTFVRGEETAGQGGGQPCKRGWGSNHTGGINFALCDGSVRFVKYSIDINVLAAMATISGGETLFDN